MRTQTHVADMLTALDWLNVENMWHWCCIYTLKRIISNLSQTLHVRSILDLNMNPMYS